MPRTGDVRQNIETLRRELRQAKYSGAVDEAALARGLPTAYLPLLSHALFNFSRHLAQYLSDRGYNAAAKNDVRMMESVFKMLRSEFSYQPKLKVSQFFGAGFAESKIIFSCDVIRLCRSKHQALWKSHKSAQHKVAMRGYRPNPRLVPKAPKPEAAQTQRGRRAPRKAPFAASTLRTSSASGAAAPTQNANPWLAAVGGSEVGAAATAAIAAAPALTTARAAAWLPGSAEQGLSRPDFPEDQTSGPAHLEMRLPIGSDTYQRSLLASADFVELASGRTQHGNDIGAPWLASAGKEEQRGDDNWMAAVEAAVASNYESAELQYGAAFADAAVEDQEDTAASGDGGGGGTVANEPPCEEAELQAEEQAMEGASQEAWMDTVRQPPTRSGTQAAAAWRAPAPVQQPEASKPGAIDQPAGQKRSSDVASSSPSSGSGSSSGSSAASQALDHPDFRFALQALTSQIQQSFASLEERLESFETQVNTSVCELQAQVTLMEGRVRCVEESAQTAAASAALSHPASPMKEPAAVVAPRDQRTTTRQLVVTQRRHKERLPALEPSHDVVVTLQEGADGQSGLSNDSTLRFVEAVAARFSEARQYMMETTRDDASVSQPAATG